MDNATNANRMVKLSRWTRSLRWRIQAWYALILGLAIVGFGSLLHWEMARAHWDNVDEQLVTAGRILEGTLRQVPREVLESMAQDVAMPRGGFRPPHRPEPNDAPVRGRRPRWDRDHAGPPDRGFGPPVRTMNPPNYANPLEGFSSGQPVPPDSDGASHEQAYERWQADETLSRLELPPQLSRGDHLAYFIIWRPDHSVLRASNVPEMMPEIPMVDENEFQHNRYLRQTRGPFREVFLRGPEHTTICVGRPALADQHQLTRAAIFIFATGFSIFAIAILGGWWSMRRTLAPLERMRATASSIQASNLKQRLDLAGIDSELSELGQSLNSMLERLDLGFDQQRRFTADASHELRTPLSVILTSTELALSKTRSADEYRAELEKCHRAALRMHGLVKSLLSLARMDSEVNANEPLPCDLASICNECVESLRVLAEPNSIRIESSLTPCSVLGHSEPLRQLITNLIVNAIHYNRSGGSVQVLLTTSDTNALVKITDTGIGIPESDIPFIFDRFYRVDAARSRQTGGTGLGLAICKEIVRLHGGTIELESQIDVGTTVVVTLPCESLAMGKGEGSEQRISSLGTLARDTVQQPNQ